MCTCVSCLYHVRTCTWPLRGHSPHGRCAATARGSHTQEEGQTVSKHPVCTTDGQRQGNEASSGGGGVNVGRRSETAARHGKESFTCGQGLLPALVAGGGSISSRLITLVAPWRRLVAMQSVPVSPPPITITCAEARRRPRCRRGEQGSTQRRISAALCLPGFKRHTCDWPGSCILFLLHCCSTP